MKITKENVKTILFIAFCIILMFVCVWQFSALLAFVGYILGVLTPVIIGFCTAFVLNIPMSFIETKIFAFLLRPDKKGRTFKFLARLLSVLITLAVVIGAISLLLFFVVPQLTDTISTIVSYIPSFTVRAVNFTQKYLDDFNISSETISDIILDSKQLLTTAGNFLKDNVGSFVDIGSSVVSGVIDALLGLFVAVYFLFDKEKLFVQIKRFSRAVLRPGVYTSLSKVLAVSSKAFSNFISGQVIEALILGTLCFIGMLIFKIPFAILVSVLICVSALVPILGAWVGAVIGFFLILISDPFKAVGFVIFILILQQLEGNLIYPRVVGKQVGLPGVWVLLAIVVGSGVMGALGALLAVPLASVMYILISQFVNFKELTVKSKND